jgi:putative methanogenesis marker 16 metalloprotein
MKTIDAINEKITGGNVVVFTAAELKRRVAEGEKVTAADVDVVTTGTFGIMSGTLATLHIPVAAPGSFQHADRAWLNGVPAMPGPCPNERLGSVDLVVFGTARADRSYGGGHLFRDIVEGNGIEVVVESAGSRFSRTVTLADMSLARMVTTRSAFKNYAALLNRNPGIVQTIFSVRGLAGPCREASVSGCGDINPLQNDPSGRVIGTGTRILLNGGTGYIMGPGTRSTRDHPNIAAFADMRQMVPEMMGGFVTSEGPECTTSVAIPIPVLDDRILGTLLVTNDRIPLPLSDIRDRAPFALSHYGEVWNSTDGTITYYPESCVQCEPCEAAEICPTGAITPGEGIDPLRCVHCGTCVQVCPGGAYTGKLGSVSLDGRPVPITLRQSSRVRGLAICDHLKALILEGKFLVTGKTGDLW